MTRTCMDCPAPITRKSKGRCRACGAREVSRKNTAAALRERALKSRRPAEALTCETTAAVKEVLASHTIAETHAIMKARGGQHVTWNQIRQLQGILQADTARDVAAAAVAALAIPKPAHAPKAPLTFEEKLARVAAGAKLVPTFTYRRADPAHSLVGNATGML